MGVEALEKSYDELKMVDAWQIAQEVAYAKQKVFAYWNKPGKQLAWVLSEELTTPIINRGGNLGGDRSDLS